MKLALLLPPCSNYDRHAWNHGQMSPLVLFAFHTLALCYPIITYLDAKVVADGVCLVQAIGGSVGELDDGRLCE